MEAVYARGHQLRISLMSNLVPTLATLLCLCHASATLLRRLPSTLSQQFNIVIGTDNGDPT